MGISCEKEGGLPATQTITCKAGDKPSITFHAESAWRVSSDAIWCKFITPAGEMFDTSGEAGTPTLTLKITDTGVTNAPTRANITIRIDGKSGILATVERGAKELSIKLYDAMGNETDKLNIGYDEYIATTIKSNFRYAAIDIPDWVEVAERDESGRITTTNSISGNSGKELEVLLRIVKNGERETSTITSNDGKFITFTDEEYSANFEFPITYEGMGNRNLTFTGPAQSYYGWEVSLDGKKFRHYNEANDTTTTFEDELQYKITAQDNDYAILFFEQHIERGISSFEYFAEEDSKRWISFDKESATLRVNEYSGKPRYGVVMALPRGIFDDIKSDVSAVFEDDISSGIALPSIKSDYVGYILIDFTQRDINAPEREGMYAYHSLTSLEIFCEPYTDATLTAKYDCQDIYRCAFVNPVDGKTPGVIVNPLIEGWDIMGYDTGSATAEVVMGERNLKMSEGEFYIGENTDEELAVHLWGPKGGWSSENVVIIFKVDNIAKKILVVTPPSI